MTRWMRSSARRSNLGLWLVALVFAGFLIGLGGIVVDDLPRVEQRSRDADLVDRGQAAPLRAAALRRDAGDGEAPSNSSAARAMRSLGPPLASALGLLLAAFAAGPLLRLFDHTTGSVGPRDTFHWIGLVIVAVLIAVAGAWRYVADKSVWEAEALEYRDAHRRFRLAEHALADALGGEGRPTDVGRAQEIVRELGRSALVENEAWLKSRRERPLTTI